MRAMLLAVMLLHAAHAFREREAGEAGAFHGGCWLDVQAGAAFSGDGGTPATRSALAATL